ncbi:MAG: DGQHR domain-containing protein [Acidobacteria bacterium]|nr:DGQHR domain-containing protein [Acidobacteriota bacterium]
MDGSFEYVFPAIRGIQAKREYYVSMCPLRLIPKIFLFNEEELVPELRAQRVLNKNRIPEMSRYILSNRDNYTFSALTASVDADVRFDPLGTEGDGKRDGEVVIKMLPDVQQQPLKPLITATLVPGTQVMTDEYDIYAKLPAWGYSHQTVCHSKGEYARDEGGDGFCEVHVNTIEGFWSLLRSWLRPHRGISQELLPLYLGFFEFVYNARKPGKALLGSLLALLLT